MPTLLQINVVSNVLSTGKIAEDIAKIAILHGWKSYIAFSRDSRPSVSQEIRIGTILDIYEHYAENILFDNEGLASRCSTRKLIKQIDEIKPDVIQLHNIHDHYLNYPLLFKYLSAIDIPIVWVQHDCWTFTGGCMYFDMTNCNKWKSSCNNCPDRRAVFCNKSAKHFQLKKRLLNSIKNLIFISVSDWIRSLLEESVQKHRRIVTIHNGIDVNIFKPIMRKGYKGKFRILGVAAVWNKRKGFDDFLRLREILPSDCEILLVGLAQKQINVLPDGVKGLNRTTNMEELVRLYSDANVFVNPTYSDNFPTTNIEALACGTPVITYKTGGSPEAIDNKTGIVVSPGDVEALAEAILQIKSQPISSEACRQRAVDNFDKDKCFEKYIELYNELLTE